tara:strand:+ start:92 stop:547 length:456 start_codon:yes stop_codon:yes gene_type:complete
MKLIAYGSLMNDYKKSNLVIVKGWKRVFNKIVDSWCWKKFSKGKEVATLNVIEDKNSSFNAVLIEYKKKDVQDIKKREANYVMKEADIFDYKTGKSLGRAKLFVSKKIGSDIVPIKEYLEACRKAAYSHGKEFGKEFEQSTYLSDKKTRIS